MPVVWCGEEKTDVSQVWSQLGLYTGYKPKKLINWSSYLPPRWKFEFLIPRTQMMEREKLLVKFIFWLSDAFHEIGMHTHVHTHVHTY